MKTAVHTSILSVLLAAGCATGYNWGSDVSEYQPGVFRVTFNGNGFTSPERASDFAMLHAAHAVLQRGYRYFIITSEDHHITNAEFHTGGSATTVGTVSGNYQGTQIGATTTGVFDASAQSTTYYHPSQTIVFHNPHATFYVIGSHEQPTNTTSFDAQFLQDSLGAHYHITLH